MARIRTLKPEIWMSPQVMNLPKDSRLLFIGLITQADDEGRGTADARRVKAAIFGGDDDTSSNVRRMLDEIAAQGLIVIYHDEKHGDLYALRSWKHHQKIDKPKPSGYPAPPIPLPVVDTSSTSRRGSEGSSGGRDRIVPEGSSREAEPVDNGDNSGAKSSDFDGQSAPPSDPQSRRNGSAERRNGNFEAINDGVSKLLATGVYTTDKPSALAQALHVSTLQVEESIRQLRDRGRLPAVAA